MRRQTKTHEEATSAGVSGSRIPCASRLEMALRCIDGRWKIQILAHLSIERMRLADLGRAIPGASQKMLIQHLRELERDGLVARKVYAEVPPKVDYRLTDWGTRLGPVVRSLVEWADSRESS